MGSTGCAGVTLGLRRASRTSRRLPSSLAEPRRHLQGRRSTPKNGTPFPRFTQRSRRALGGPWLASEHDHHEIVEHGRPSPDIETTQSNLKPPRRSEERSDSLWIGREPSTASKRHPPQPPRSKERSGIKGVGLATIPSSSSSPRLTSALRRTPQPARGRPRSSGVLVSAPRLDRRVPKNAWARLGDASKLTSAWRG